MQSDTEQADSTTLDRLLNGEAVAYTVDGEEFDVRGFPIDDASELPVGQDILEVVTVQQLCEAINDGDDRPRIVLGGHPCDVQTAVACGDGEILIIATRVE